MKNAVHLPIPALRALHQLGKDLSEARRRRRIPIELMAERAGISRATVGKIEKGDPTASMGGYASVLFVLGMVERLKDIASITHDIVGQRLDADNLPKRIRFPRKKNMT